MSSISPLTTKNLIFLNLFNFLIKFLIFFSSRENEIILAHSFANFSTHSNPTPCVPPDTKTFFPLKSKIMVPYITMKFYYQINGIKNINCTCNLNTINII